MKGNTHRESIPVPKGSFLHLGQGGQIEIGCDSGAVWITQDNDVRDVVLSAGERFVSDRPGAVLVYALRQTVVTATARVERPRASFWRLLYETLRPVPLVRRLVAG